MAKAKSEIYVGVNEKAVEALIERNLSLLDGMTEEAKKKMIQILTDGLIKGSGIDDLIDALEEAGLAYDSKAEMIARTEIMYGLNEGALRRYQEDGIEYVQWLAGPDDRCCDECLSLDGQVFKIGEQPDCPVHPDCRCTLVPYFKEDEEEE